MRMTGIVILAALWAALTAPHSTADDPERAPAGLSLQPVVLIQLAVSDLDRAVAFYSEVLELELESRTAAMQWAKFKTGIPGLSIGLGAGGDVEGSGTVSVNLGVGDIDRARALLESRGVTFDGPTTSIPGVVRLADFRDPDGNRLRLAGPPKPTAETNDTEN